MPVPVVSVVIAVYNMAEHLQACLHSIWDQSIGVEHLEVIAVDDGSTDASLDLLDAWAATHPELLVVRGPRTGAPGAPRNHGIDLSRGEYVFFADPDDYLGREALERMHRAAEQNGSEVVLGRICGVGRRAPTRPFLRSVGRGDVVSTDAVWTLTAHKLFSRDLLVHHGLRFAEGARLAEEQTLVVPALFLASSISVVADYDCYYLVSREGVEHLTQQTADPTTFWPIVRSSLETVRAHVDDGPVRDALVRRWVGVEIAGKFSPRFAGQSPATQSALLDGAREILDELVPERVDLLLPLVKRLRVAAVRRGAPDLVHELGAFDTQGPIGVPVEAGDRVLAPWPGLRDPRWAVPDAYYDVTDALVPELAAVSVETDGRWRIGVHVRPATPAGRDAAVDWEVCLRRGVDEHRVPVVGGVARVDLVVIDPAPAPGPWAVVLAARSVAEELRHAVGVRGASCEVAANCDELVGASLQRSPRGALLLVVRDDLPRRPVLSTTGVRWRRGRLELALDATQARGDAVLVLRSGEQTRRVPLVLSDAVLRGSFVPDRLLTAGRWSLHLASRHPSSEVTARVRLEPGTRTPRGRLARLVPVGTEGWARLEVVSRRRWVRLHAGRVVSRLRRRRGAAYGR